MLTCCLPKCYCKVEICVFLNVSVLKGDLSYRIFQSRICCRIAFDVWGQSLTTERFRSNLKTASFHFVVWVTE